MPTYSNFVLLAAPFPALYQAAQEAERHVWSAPRYVALCCRFGLENAVRWLYDHDGTLTLPYQDNLGALLHEPTFRQLMPAWVWQGAN